MVDVCFFLALEGCAFQRQNKQERSMINLINATSGEQIGTISEDQLQFLMDNLEEEWLDDQDYYLNSPTIDMLEARGADPTMIALLRGSVSEQGIDVRWNRAI
jgi:processive 1,2-diacylglycerol beta-glucosyltransferase